MMQAAYDERQRSMDYIDYQRTANIRANRTGSPRWRGRRLPERQLGHEEEHRTGEYWEGKPTTTSISRGRTPSTTSRCSLSTPGPLGAPRPLGPPGGQHGGA